jgi:nitrogen fixation protein FixH
VAIIGCATFIVYCNRHPADLISADYYEQEVRYQGHIDSVAHARQSPHPATVAYDRQRQLIRIVLPPEARQGKAAGTIQLYRPAAADLDRQFKLEPDAQGVQTLDAARLAPGLWKVRASWTVGDQGYFIDQPVVIRSRA